MPRADLHYALVLDAETYEASRVDPSLLDPLVRVEGALPGLARPVAVVRDYQGPQGTYTESFQLLDSREQTVYSSPVVRIEMHGEAFEDRVVTVVNGLELRDVEEHRAIFTVDGEEVGDVPVFVTAGTGGDPYLAAEQGAMKALQKSTVAWLSVPQPDARRRKRGQPTGPHEQAVWFVLLDGKVYVVVGPGEQRVPNLPGAPEVELIVRSKETRSRIARVPSAVRVVAPSDDLFDVVATAGLGKRLNLHDGEAALERWKSTCTLLELTPRFRPVAATPEPQVATPGNVTAAEAAAVVADAPAAEAAPAGPAKRTAADIHVEAEVDQEVFDSLVASGTSERVARAKAKAAFVRREKQRILAEEEGAA